MHVFKLIGSDRSPRRGDLVRASVRDIMLRRALKEFLKHFKESRGVLGSSRESKQAGKQANK